MFQYNIIIIYIIFLLLFPIYGTLTLIMSIEDRNCSYAIKAAFIFILWVLSLNAIIKTNPYPIFKLTEEEYEYFIENDYGPKRISEYIKLREKIDKNKIEMIESMLQNISKDK